MLRGYLIACLLFAAPARAVCTIDDRAHVTLARSSDGLLLAPARLDGQAVDLVLDTGAERTVLSAASAQALGLKSDRWVSTGMEGVGGVARHRNADVTSVTIGGLALRRRALAGVVSLPVAPGLEQVFNGTAAAGLLGMDLLSVFDLEIDPAGPSLTLHGVAGCAGRFAPWGGAYVAVPVSLPRVGVMVAPVTVNGVALRALLDTGASMTILDARAAGRLGITPGRPDGAARGVGPNVLATRTVALTELRVGASSWPKLRAAVALLPGVGYDMVLGIDVLGSRRLWLSFSTSQLFVGGG